MKYKNVFKRYEIKYLLSLRQACDLKKTMAEFMKGDAFGNSTIGSLYYDTDDFLLIRRSLEKPVYKEKLRLRGYGAVRPETAVFPELKKKFDSVVYKRRLEMTEAEAEACLSGKSPFPDSQIGREISYCFTRYENLMPRVFISYEREAFFAKDDADFRITFDRNILWRGYDLSLCKGAYGSPVLPPDRVLLEIKTAGAIPLWLVRFLSENKIYKTSFSKYGNAYLSMLSQNTKKGENLCA